MKKVEPIYHENQGMLSGLKKKKVFAEIVKCDEGQGVVDAV